MIIFLVVVILSRSSSSTKILHASFSHHRNSIYLPMFSGLVIVLQGYEWVRFFLQSSFIESLFYVHVDCYKSRSYDLLLSLLLHLFEFFIPALDGFSQEFE